MKLIKILYSCLIGAFIGGISSFFLQNYEENNKSPWKSFSFLWSAPILLFIPLYISYTKGSNGSLDFLHHVFIGTIATLLAIIFTITLINFKVNNLLALVLNFIFSYILIYIYFKYKLHKII